jgi:hypothetical protein
MEVQPAAGVRVEDIRVTLNGTTDVTSAFKLRSDGKYAGLVTGLQNGVNTISAQVFGGPSTSLTVTNHPKGGPIFSGPQRQPWICMTEQNGLGVAQDEQCNAPTKVEYFYRSTDTGTPGFLPYDPSSPPADVRTTTTDEGKTVPFIVRRERGTLNRYVYDIAVLADPSQAVSPWEPPAAWNRKLYYLYQGGALPQHIQGNPPNVFNERALSRGFATATSSGNVFGSSTNSVTSAEVTMMVKERITETLGEIRYTLAEGSSGGSMQQHLIANAYPGLLDGIQPSLSYQDLWSTNNEVQDCSLLLRYFNANSGLWSDAVERNAVMENAADQPGTCIAWAASDGRYLLDRAWMDPSSGSSFGTGANGVPSGVGLPAAKQPWMYDPIANPSGVRSTLQDYQVNIFGQRPDGKANRPYDNVGVQYGLKALKVGTITVEQFVHLNENVGGRDIDWQPTAQRSNADLPGLDAVYRSGQVNLGTGLASIPVIDIRACGNSEIHSCFHSWVTRERLKKYNGNADNHVILTAGAILDAGVPPDTAGGAAASDEAFNLLDKWMAAIKADTSTDAQSVKVARNRPAEASDACWISGVRSTNPAACQDAHPRFGDSRTGADAPLTIDVMKCQLKPMDRASYGVTFTDSQWTRLQAVFSTGVCDWAAASVGHADVTPWLSYAEEPGGKPMGPAPNSR